MYTDIRFRYPSPCGQYACMGIDRYSEKKTSLSILLYPTPSHLPPHVTLSRGPPPGPLRPLRYHDLRLPKPRCVSIKWSSRVLTSPAAATLPSRAFSYIIQYLLKLLGAPPPPPLIPHPFHPGIGLRAFLGCRARHHGRGRRCKNGGGGGGHRSKFCCLIFLHLKFSAVKVL